MKIHIMCSMNFVYSQSVVFFFTITLLPRILLTALWMYTMCTVTDIHLKYAITNLYLKTICQIWVVICNASRLAMEFLLKYLSSLMPLTVHNFVNIFSSRRRHVSKTLWILASVAVPVQPMYRVFSFSSFALCLSYSEFSNFYR